MLKVLKECKRYGWLKAKNNDIDGDILDNKLSELNGSINLAYIQLGKEDDTLDIDTSIKTLLLD